jgi:hypothetical protein
MTQPPIVFLIFNRPDVTARTFATIRAARPDRLLVVADGPRPGRSGEEELCTRTRSVIDGVDWPCEVLRNFARTNMGCGRRVASGLDWAFEQVEEAIILEDDCLPDQSFFRYCEELLKRYRTYERVMMISGNNFQNGTSRTLHSYYFSQSANCWGWATWRRAWRHFDYEIQDWRERRDLSLIRAIAKNETQVQFWEHCFDSIPECDTWDFQWMYCLLARNGLSIAPDVNLVTNIGLGHPAATHTLTANGRLVVPSCAMEFPLRHPDGVTPCVKADEFEHERLYDKESSRRPVSDCSLELLSAEAKIASLGARLAEHKTSVNPDTAVIEAAALMDPLVADFYRIRLAAESQAARIAELNIALEVARQEIESTRVEAAAQLQAQSAAFLASPSWRITAPLRALSGLLYR